MVRQAVRPRAVTQQRDVAERRTAIGFLAVGDVGDGGQPVGVAVLELDPQVAIAPSGDAFRRIQVNQVGAGDPVQDAPDLGVRISILDYNNGIRSCR